MSETAKFSLLVLHCAALAGEQLGGEQSSELRSSIAGETHGGLYVAVRLASDGSQAIGSSDAGALAAWLRSVYLPAVKSWQARTQAGVVHWVQVMPSSKL